MSSALLITVVPARWSAREHAAMVFSYKEKKVGLVYHIRKEFSRKRRYGARLDYWAYKLDENDYEYPITPADGY